MLPVAARDLGLMPMFPPSGAIVVWAAGYSVVVLGLGLRQFHRRAL